MEKKTHAEDPTREQRKRSKNAQGWLPERQIGEEDAGLDSADELFPPEPHMRDTDPEKEDVAPAEKSKEEPHCTTDLPPQHA